MAMNFWQEIQTRYWFIPAILSLFSILLSIAAIQLDLRLQVQDRENFNWLSDNQPDGARAVLSTIAGSMITVAGVVFSITLVTVSSAASQYGPRLLTIFMRDRTNQVTLGVFIATFLYCLLVLRAVQDRPPGASAGDAAYFVPHIALFIGIGFALCSIAVLIRFIHHVPQSIHISLVIARIGNELCERVTERFPKNMGQSSSETRTDQGNPELPAIFSETPSKRVKSIRSAATGFIRVVDQTGLMKIAQEHNLFIRLIKHPGDFTITHEVLMIYPDSHELPDDVQESLSACYAVGPKRTPVQDIRFLIQELTEIAARALSPGINDPVTAITCLKWLTAALARLAESDDPNSIRADKNGAPRIHALELKYDDLLTSSFGHLRSYFAEDPVAAASALNLLDRLAATSSGPKLELIQIEKTRLIEAMRDVMPESILNQSLELYEAA